MNVGGLFSGIGGWELGLERAGMRIAWHCERDEFCRRVLAHHWPIVPCYPDVRRIVSAAVEPVDVLAGGFPCPAVSQAARGRNVAEWLWPEYARLVRELRPRYVLVENVAGLLYAGRGFGDILGDLADCGFDAAWRVLRASDFGASHHRARVWLVGYAHGEPEPNLTVDDETPGLPELRGVVRGWADPPRDLGMVDGLPNRVDRLSALGNALVPRIAEWIGRAVMLADENELREAA